MTECAVARSIAVLCNEDEQLSANEMLRILMDDRPILVEGELYDIEDVTERIDEDDKNDFISASLFGEETKVREIYIKTIQELCE